MAKPRAPSNILVVSAATEDHFNALACMVSTARVTDPTSHVLVFSLDTYTWDRRAHLFNANNRVSVREVNWTAMPAFARVRPQLREKRYESERAGHYAWKPLLIAQVFKESAPGRAIVWLDAEHRLIRQGVVSALVSRARTLNGVLSLWTAGTLGQWTHPLMLAYMYNSSATLGRSRQQRLQLFKQQNCDASTVVFLRGYALAAQVLSAWAACALVRRCIAPPGSSRTNHRQDQAALTVILQVASAHLG